MSAINLLALILVLLGLSFFLYGSVFYNSLIGWIGFYLLIGGLLSFLFIYIYNNFYKKNNFTH